MDDLVVPLVQETTIYVSFPSPLKATSTAGGSSDLWVGQTDLRGVDVDFSLRHFPEEASGTLVAHHACRTGLVITSPLRGLSHLEDMRYNSSVSKCEYL